MILDKLIEKKDIQAYLVGRIAHLQTERKKAGSIKNTKKREVAARQIQGRIKECQNLRMILDNSQVKTLSRKLWKKAITKTATYGVTDKK